MLSALGVVADQDIMLQELAQEDREHVSMPNSPPIVRRMTEVPTPQLLNLTRLISITRLGRLRLMLAALLLTALIGTLDYMTGVRLRLFPLYFVPVAMVAVGCSRREAVIGALLATCTWGLANHGTDQANWIHGVNLVSQAVAFSVIALLVNGLKSQAAYQEGLALTDPLTGLANARAFRAAAALELERQRRGGHLLTLAYLDIDDFKQVNEQLGHVGADELLGAVGRAMRDCVRATDLLARVGGDEFALLLPHTDDASARFVLNRIQRRVAASATDAVPSLTFSIGGVVFPAAPPDVDAMLSESDALMYEAKAKGKNLVLIRTATPTK